jgi:hypothetical protein
MLGGATLHANCTQKKAGQTNFASDLRFSMVGVTRFELVTAIRNNLCFFHSASPGKESPDADMLSGFIPGNPNAGASSENPGHIARKVHKVVRTSDFLSTKTSGRDTAIYANYALKISDKGDERTVNSPFTAPAYPRSLDLSQKNVHIADKDANKTRYGNAGSQADAERQETKSSRYPTRNQKKYSVWAKEDVLEKKQYRQQRKLSRRKTFTSRGRSNSTPTILRRFCTRKDPKTDALR